MKRKDFIKGAAASAFLSTVPKFAVSNEQKPANKNYESKIWAILLHLSYNMWDDNTPPEYEGAFKGGGCRDAFLWAQRYHPELTFDKNVWDNILQKISESGINTVVIDLGDGVKYESHPEIAVKGAWEPSFLKKELKKIRSTGLEPIPKLNFSAGHKAWLGKYHRMLSTDIYYGVCKDLIEEVCDIFDKPPLFHLGMDEETIGHQKSHSFAVVRQGDLWWHDLYYLVDQVERKGMRSWVWSDYAWNHPEVFFNKMPKTVLQSNWYYENQFKPSEFDHIQNIKYLALYDKLETHGYEQVPTGSNHRFGVNFKRTVEYCEKTIAPERLKGFMQSIWRPVLPPCEKTYFEAIDQVEEVIHQRR